MMAKRDRLRTRSGRAKRSERVHSVKQGQILVVVVVVSPSPTSSPSSPSPSAHRQLLERDKLFLRFCLTHTFPPAFHFLLSSNANLLSLSAFAVKLSKTSHVCVMCIDQLSPCLSASFLILVLTQHPLPVHASCVFSPVRR
jgi:hypothetical protein